jgi:HlyD family secretion protein
LNPELKLKPGMTANSTVVYAERQDAIRVPNAALRFHPPPEMLALLGGGRPSAKGHGPGGASGATSSGSWSGGARGATARTPSAAAAVLTEGKKTVWVLRDGKPASVRITTGVTDGTLSEVTEGPLQPGDVLITGIASAPAAGTAGGPPRRLF